MRRQFLLAFHVAVVALVAAPTFADSPHALRYDLRADGVMTAAAAGAWLAAELAKDRIAPSACRWCGSNAVDTWARDRLAWDHPRRARLSSDLLAFGVLPVAVGSYDLLTARSTGHVRAGLVDVVLIAEATAIALDLNTLVKVAVARQRPVPPGTGGTPSRGDANLSFPSGHTAVAFALASSAATVAELRGYRTARWVWGAGLTLAAAVGYFRLAGDAHHLTDVAAGAALGASVGIAVPRLLHGREERRMAIVPVAPVGIALSF